MAEADRRRAARGEESAVSQQINLYSPIFRKQEKVFSATTMLQGFVLIVVVVTVFFYSISLQSSVLEIRAAESGRQLKSELERLKAYGAGESPAERAKALAERKKTLDASLASQTQALAALDSGALGRAQGYSELLRALARVSMEGVWLTRIQFAEGGGELSIAGRATRADLVPVYLERLRSEAALRGQQFSRLEVTRPAAAPKAGATFVEFMLSSGEAESPK
jgi:Tfp pilus assembly protein PilN